MDPVGWFIATLHNLIGHEQAAAVIGGAMGDRGACLLCGYEAHPTEEGRQAVIRALVPEVTS